MGAPCPDYWDQTRAEHSALGRAWVKRERRQVQGFSTIAGTVARLGAAFTGGEPGQFIPEFIDAEDDCEEAKKIQAEREAKLAAADQRALIAALSATSKKTNGV